MFSRVVSNFRKKRRKSRKNEEITSRLNMSPEKCVFNDNNLSNFDCKSDFSCIDSDDMEPGCDKGCCC